MAEAVTCRGLELALTRRPFVKKIERGMVWLATRF